MDYEDVADRLHDFERKLMLALKKRDVQTSEELMISTKLDESSVNRALLWLSSKDLIKVDEEVKELILLGVNGEKYVDDGLPEKRFLKLMSEGIGSLAELREALGKDEFNVSIGLLKSNGYIKIEQGLLKVTKQGSSWYKSKTLSEQLIALLSKGVVDHKSLKKEFLPVVKELASRKQVIKSELKTVRTARLAPEGRKVMNFVKLESLLGQLTPELIVNGSWKDHKFRKYDLKAPSPRVFHGKKLMLSYIVDKVRRVFLDMGFTEMKGNVLEESFWNFDALYQPQDHPAREMHDTFFIKKPFTSPLPSKELVKRVARTHENGWTTGSRGWGYDWKEDIASTNVLRTHTTGVSAKTLSTLSKDDFPAKFFSVDTVFRNETLDYKHLFQFFQVEGIIVNPKANFKQLLGMLKVFLNRLGFDKVRFRPGYFPYTEMSVEPEVLHPVKKEWMELGGAGMFRPEVVKPLMGVEVPVLAWGLGFERLIMDLYNITDIRDIYSDDINKLREMTGFTKRF